MLILASNSPRRRQLLNLAGWTFHVIPAVVDESLLPKEAPQNYVVRLARNKALDVATMASPEDTVIAADTAVVDNATILGKPTNVAHALEMLRGLRGHSHQVYTGLAALQGSSGRLLTDLCISNVHMRDYADPEIQAYISSGDPLDKAGAYAIQHRDFNPVGYLEGCYANVVGLPLCHLARLLRQFDLYEPADITTRCQTQIDYHCQISDWILS